MTDPTEKPTHPSMFSATFTRRRYSMNYSSYEATNTQPSEQARRMLDYMFPGYQKRDPRDWYEMEIQTEMNGKDVEALVGSVLTDADIPEPKQSINPRLSTTSIQDTLQGDAAAQLAMLDPSLWEDKPVRVNARVGENLYLQVDDVVHNPRHLKITRDLLEQNDLSVKYTTNYDKVEVANNENVPMLTIRLGDRLIFPASDAEEKLLAASTDTKKTYRFIEGPNADAESRRAGGFNSYGPVRTVNMTGDLKKPDLAQYKDELEPVAREDGAIPEVEKILETEEPYMEELNREEALRRERVAASSMERSWDIIPWLQLEDPKRRGSEDVTEDKCDTKKPAEQYHIDSLEDPQMRDQPMMYLAACDSHLLLPLVNKGEHDDIYEEVIEVDPNEPPVKIRVSKSNREVSTKDRSWANPKVLRRLLLELEASQKQGQKYHRRSDQSMKRWSEDNEYREPVEFRQEEFVRDEPYHIEIEPESQITEEVDSNQKAPLSTPQPTIVFNAEKRQRAKSVGFSAIPRKVITGLDDPSKPLEDWPEYAETIVDEIVTAENLDGGREGKGKFNTRESPFKPAGDMPDFYDFIQIPRYTSGILALDPPTTNLTNLKSPLAASFFTDIVELKHDPKMFGPSPMEPHEDVPCYHYPLPTDYGGILVPPTKKFGAISGKDKEVRNISVDSSDSNGQGSSSMITNTTTMNSALRPGMDANWSGKSATDALRSSPSDSSRSGKLAPDQVRSVPSDLSRTSRALTDGSRLTSMKDQTPQPTSWDSGQHSGTATSSSSFFKATTDSQTPESNRQQPISGYQTPESNRSKSPLEPQDYRKGEISNKSVVGPIASFLDIVSGVSSKSNTTFHSREKSPGNEEKTIVNDREIDDFVNKPLQRTSSIDSVIERADKACKEPYVKPPSKEFEKMMDDWKKESASNKSPKSWLSRLKVKRRTRSRSQRSQSTYRSDYSDDDSDNLSRSTKSKEESYKEGSKKGKTRKKRAKSRKWGRKEIDLSDSESSDGDSIGSESIRPVERGKTEDSKIKKKVSHNSQVPHHQTETKPEERTKERYKSIDIVRNLLSRRSTGEERHSTPFPQTEDKSKNDKHLIEESVKRLLGRSKTSSQSHSSQTEIKLEGEEKRGSTDIVQGQLGTSTPPSQHSQTERKSEVEINGGSVNSSRRSTVEGTQSRFSQTEIRSEEEPSAGKKESVDSVQISKGNTSSQSRSSQTEDDRRSIDSIKKLLDNTSSQSRSSQTEHKKEDDKRSSIESFEPPITKSAADSQAPLNQRDKLEEHPEKGKQDLVERDKLIRRDSESLQAGKNQMPETKSEASSTSKLGVPLKPEASHSKLDSSEKKSQGNHKPFEFFHGVLELVDSALKPTSESGLQVVPPARNPDDSQISTTKPPETVGSVSAEKAATATGRVPRMEGKPQDSKKKLKENETVIQQLCDKGLPSFPNDSPTVDSNENRSADKAEKKGPMKPGPSILEFPDYADLVRKESNSENVTGGKRVSPAVVSTESRDTTVSIEVAPSSDDPPVPPVRGQPKFPDYTKRLHKEGAKKKLPSSGKYQPEFPDFHELLIQRVISKESLDSKPVDAVKLAKEKSDREEALRKRREERRKLFEKKGHRPDSDDFDRHY